MMVYGKTVLCTALVAATLAAIPVAADTPAAQQYLLTIDLHGEGGATEPARLVAKAGETARFVTGTEGGRMFSFEATPVAKDGKIAVSYQMDLSQGTPKVWSAVIASNLQLDDAQPMTLRLAVPPGVQDKPVEVTLNVQNVLGS
jgi:hypothetical protein